MWWKIFLKIKKWLICNNKSLNISCILPKKSKVVKKKKKQTIKLFEEITGHGPSGPGAGRVLRRTLKAESTKDKNDRLHIIKIKIFCCSKDTVENKPDNLHLGEQICTSQAWQKTCTQTMHGNINIQTAHLSKIFEATSSENKDRA